MSEFAEGVSYLGEVVDQSLVPNKNDTGFTLFLTLRLLGRCIDPRNPEAALEDCPPREVDVGINLNPVGEYFEYRMFDLLRLGFSEEDVTRLDPGHDQFHSFLGIKVPVSPKAGKSDPSKLFWNLAFPRTSRSKPLDDKAKNKLNRFVGPKFAEMMKKAKEARKSDKESADVSF